MKAAIMTGVDGIGAVATAWTIGRFTVDEKTTGCCARPRTGAKPRADRRYPVVKRPHRAA